MNDYNCHCPSAMHESECPLHPDLLMDTFLAMQIEIVRLRESEEYAWKNTHIIEKERQALQLKIAQMQEIIDKAHLGITGG